MESDRANCLFSLRFKKINMSKQLFPYQDEILKYTLTLRIPYLLQENHQH